MKVNLVNALWRTRGYIIPQLKHFVGYALLVGLTVLLQLATFLIGFDLLTNKVFLSEPLSAFQAALLNLPAPEYVDVQVLADGARSTLRNVFLVFIASMFAAQFLIGATLPYYVTWILQRVNQHLRMDMMDRAVHLSLRYHADSEVGDAIYRVYQDSAMVTNVVQNVLIQPLTILSGFAGAFVALSFFAPNLGLLFLLAGVISIVVAARFTPRLRRQSERARLATSGLTSHIQESVGSVRLLKACQAEGAALAEFNARSLGALDRAYEIRRSVAQLKLYVLLLTGVVILVGDYLMATWVWHSEPTFGYGVVALVGFAVWNLGAFQAAREQSITVSTGSVRLAGLWSVLQDMAVGLERAFFLLDLEPAVVDRPNARALPDVKQRIEFKAVHFAYDPAAPVLRGVSFIARPGTLTAIVGNTGSGKSTLLNLLLRLYEPDRGAIEIDGTDIRDIRVGDLRHAISVVLQENALFPTSIRDNIKYAAPHSSDADVARAAHVACADEFIRELAAGYDTELGERGSKLSTGQRQRISIARAVLKNAPVLVLDEPTASLDVQTEHTLMQRLADWGGDKIIFFVTHRIATIKKADQILFLDHGEVVEQGSHDELMADERGRYRHFVATEVEQAS